MTLPGLRAIALGAHVFLGEKRFQPASSRCADRFDVGVFLVKSEVARVSTCEALRVHRDRADQEDSTALSIQPVRH